MSRFHIERIISVPVRPLSAVVKEHFPSKGPDLLTIDVEGLKFRILKAFDISIAPPKTFCAETHGNNGGKPTKNEELIRFIVSQAYRVFSDTYLNTILVRESIFPNICDREQDESAFDISEIRSAFPVTTARCGIDRARTQWDSRRRGSR
jgi:hypothetical protein